ncbi:hypothetical protein Q8A64_01465 [Oxalobacteraceae bacterium R-40]|uniref:Uncharacterized protein n=1 Tax=Keguizhuia sedimenti TaxID=3064264 RepID=A0ABU1BJ98_9BURK|nr:hypothetical protein [Oxalobacteraceae bacterium R-40]
MPYFDRLAVLVIAATFSLHAAGCESSSTVKPAAQISQQLIVKFQPRSIACDAQAIARFSKAADVQLEWLRPMSGEACVVIQTANTLGELMKGQEWLKKHPAIEWMEIDAAMQRH